MAAFLAAIFLCFAVAFWRGLIVHGPAIAGSFCVLFFCFAVTYFLWLKKGMAMKVTVKDLHGSGPILAKTKVAKNGDQFVQIYQRAKTINPFKQLYYAIKNITDSRIKPAEQWVRENVDQTCGKLDAMMLKQIFRGIKNQHEQSPEVFIKPNAFDAHNQTYSFSENISFGFTNKNFASSLDLNHELMKLLEKQNNEFASSKSERSASRTPQQLAAYKTGVVNRFKNNASSSNSSLVHQKTDQDIFVVSKYYFSEIKNITQEEKEYLKNAVKVLLAKLNLSPVEQGEINVIKALKEVEELLVQNPSPMPKEELKNLLTKIMTEAVPIYQKFKAKLQQEPELRGLSLPMVIDSFLLRDFKQALNVFLHFYEGESRPNDNQKLMLESLASFLSENKQFMPVDMLATFEKRLNALGIQVNLTASIENLPSHTIKPARNPDSSFVADNAVSDSESKLEIDASDAGEE